MQADRAVTFHCGNPINAQIAPAPLEEIDGQTARIQSSAGLVVVLEGISQRVDDENLGTHLCSTQYLLKSAVGHSLDFGGNVAERDRPVRIQIDGFSPDGKLVYVLEVEGGEHPVLHADEFDPSTGADRWVHLTKSFLRTVSPACATTLHLTGLTADNWFVLATSEGNGCPTAQSWKLFPYHITEPGKVQPNVPPVRLDSLQGVTPLDPGTVIPQ